MNRAQTSAINPTQTNVTTPASTRPSPSSPVNTTPEVRADQQELAVRDVQEPLGLADQREARGRDGQDAAADESEDERLQHGQPEAGGTTPSYSERLGSRSNSSPDTNSPPLSSVVVNRGEARSPWSLMSLDPDAP